MQMMEMIRNEEKRVVKEEVKKFMNDQLLNLHSHSRPYIYKVPKELRNGHGKIFEPVSVPIGPLHYDDKCPAQQLKKWCLKNFIERYEDKEEGMESLANCMSELEFQVRGYYNDIDKIELGGPHELIKIMLLDGCFIMELFWNMDDINVDDHQRKHVETVLDSVPFLTLQQDLLKIENQLPFIVLKVLAGLRAPDDKKINQQRDNNIKNNIQQDQDLIRLALNFFDISTAIDPYVGGTPSHLLELVMNALFRHTTPRAVPINVDTNSQLGVNARSASELELYGIRFRAVDSRNMADIAFSTTSGVIKMPKLNIQESTLWNFMIFEMLSCETRVVSSYIILMGTLISNDKDVEVLLGSKILASGYDARRMVSMFAEMSAMVNKKNFGLGHLTNQINTYCESKYRKMRANFVRRHYDSRWELLNNILLFILTTTQTLFSVLGYNPKSPSGPG